MMVSIVIPAFNEEKLIGETLRSVRAALAPLARRGWSTEMVVCDNNCTDRTAEIAQAAGARVVFEPVNQISRARNRGASVAQGDWLVFVDADSCPSAELMEAVALAIESGRCIGGGSTVTMGTSPWWSWVLLLSWNGLSRACCWMAGSFIFCQSGAFRKLGGFSEELFISEEIEFSRRLKRLGRAQRLRVRILHGHPLQTSNRKLYLYRWRDYVRLLWRAAADRGASFRNRGACAPWYDGRR